MQPLTLVTGVTGFAGCYLAEALLARGESIVGVSRRAAWPPAWRTLQGRVPLIAADLCDAVAVAHVVADVRPTRVYHLAGYAHVGASFRDPEAAWQGNLTATRRLCEALLALPARPRLLFVGSGLVYGRQPDPSRPLDEMTPLCPDTPYGASKAAADLACCQYAAAGLDVVRARPFNHTGPRQSPEFAIPGFARQLAAIARGDQAPVVQTGDLSASRDLTDVRDTVVAYTLLMEHGRTGEAYNIASGRSWSMRAVLDCLVGLSGLQVEIVTRRDDLVRPSEPAAVVADASKLRRETGWQPRFALEQTLADTYDRTMTSANDER